MLNHFKELRQNKLKTFLTLLILCSVVFTSCKTAESAILPVYINGTVQNTQFGQVEGYEDFNGQTLVWKGIPYAKAPVGDLRWKEPVDPEPWEGILNAKDKGSIGIQFSWGKILGSEDCLNLDIYRPNSNDMSLPVLYYIHGGNNQTGESGELNARQLAAKTNAVVVSVNYRLGLLGFNNLPSLRKGSELEKSGNFALLDMAKSLDWVANNIAYFGGNPSNITVSGFSAGGRDVMALLISPIFKGKFHKAITFSGGMTLADYDVSAELIAKAIAPLVVEDKVKESVGTATTWLLTDGEDVKDYLYSITPERLAPLMGNAGIRMEVFPHLFNDGKVIPKNGFSTKIYNDVPLIMVTSSGEFSLFSRYGAPFMPTVSDEELLTDSENSKKYQFVFKYGSRLYELFNAQESAQRIFKNYNAPIYTCDFDWGSNPDIVGDKMANIYGSFHGVWIPFLAHEPSGFSGNFVNSFDNDGARNLANKFTAYITNFLWNNNPNGDELIEWKSWSSQSEGPSQLLLDADKDKAIITMSDNRVEYSNILKEMEEDTSISKEDKQILIKTVLNGRWFSKDLDIHFGNTNQWVSVE